MSYYKYKKKNCLKTQHHFVVIHYMLYWSNRKYLYRLIDSCCFSFSLWYLQTFLSDLWMYYLVHLTATLYSWSFAACRNGRYRYTSPFEFLLRIIIFCEGRRGCYRMNNNYLCNNCLSSLKLWGVLDTTLWDNSFHGHNYNVYFFNKVWEIWMVFNILESQSNIKTNRIKVTQI